MALFGLLLVLLGSPLVALAAGGTAADSTTPHAAPAPKRATVTIRSVRPLVVAGARFIPRERVRVTADERVKHVLAGRGGRFVARFSGIDTCSGVVVTATGSRGSRAQLSFAQLSDIHCL